MSSENKSIHAVVLAGGKGTRLAPYTRIIPKPLMPIGDKPILEIMLRQMKRAGIRQVTLAVGYLGDLMRLFFLDGKRLGLKIDYVQEEKPLGTSGPLANVKGLTDTFLVTNGDVLTDLDFGNSSRTTASMVPSPPSPLINARWPSIWALLRLTKTAWS